MSHEPPDLFADGVREALIQKNDEISRLTAEVERLRRELSAEVSLRQATERALNDSAEARERLRRERDDMRARLSPVLDECDGIERLMHLYRREAAAERIALRKVAAMGHQIADERDALAARVGSLEEALRGVLEPVRPGINDPVETWLGVSAPKKAIGRALAALRADTDTDPSPGS